MFNSTRSSDSERTARSREYSRRHRAKCTSQLNELKELKQEALPNLYKVIGETISAVEIDNDIPKVLQNLRQVQFLLHQIIYGPIMSVMQPSDSNDQSKHSNHYSDVQEASSSNASSPSVLANWQADPDLDSLVRLLGDDTKHSSLTEIFGDVPSFLHGSPSPQLPGEVSTIFKFQ